MAEVTVTEAIKLIGKTRATIYRHIKSGKLSRNSNGQLDTTELIRVYGEIYHNDTKDKLNVSVPKMYQDTNGKNETYYLNQQVESLKNQLADTKHQLERSQKKEDDLIDIMKNRLPAPENDPSIMSLLKNKFL